MIDIFMNDDFKKKYEELSNEIKNKIQIAVLEIHKENLSKIESIPNSKLYIMKVGKKVIVLSRQNNTILLMDIMSQKEFSDEFRKSLFFF
ncbi:Uncharacterised protein [uncultured archaeon]|nr:Uncharacterised protein [uncultured archaeon]